MKPSITPELSASGKTILAFQFEGIDAGTLREAMSSRKVVAFAMPHGHSFQATWLFRLILDGGAFFEFSSASTQVVDWQEVGSLNIRFGGHLSNGSSDAGPEFETAAIPALRLRALERLVYEDDDVVTDCALVLTGEDGEEIVVAAAIPPGAVTVEASFTDGHFEPQFAVSKCRRERL